LEEEKKPGKKDDLRGKQIEEVGWANKG